MDKIFEKFFGRVVEGNRGEFFQSKHRRKMGQSKHWLLHLSSFWLQSILHSCLLI